MKEKNSNGNSKVIIWLLMLFIMIVVSIQFCCSTSMYIITPEIIICLALLVLLCLSDSFDNLSIPKLISMSKKVEEVKTENNALKEANMKLISQIVSFNSTNNQNIYLPYSYNTVGSTNIEAVANNKETVEVTEEIIDNEKTTTPEGSPTGDQTIKSVFEKRRVTISERRKYDNALRIYLLKRVLQDDIENSNLQYNVKLIGNNFENNVMKTEVSFDALKVDGRNRVFYEIKTLPFLSSYTYRLHYALSVIEKYKESNNSPVAKLCLIIPQIDDELCKYFHGFPGRYEFFYDEIVNLFEPAISNGLLEIIRISVTKDELDNYIKENNMSN